MNFINIRQNKDVFGDSLPNLGIIIANTEKDALKKIDNIYIGNYTEKNLPRKKYVQKKNTA